LRQKSVKKQQKIFFDVNIKKRQYN